MGYVIFSQRRLNIMNFIDDSTALKAGLMAMFFFLRKSYLIEI
jgi:hypothetical protein